MKKILMSLCVAAVLLFAVYASHPIAATPPITTAASTTAAVTTAPGTVSMYVYSDLDDLIDQIYQDVYDQIYQEIYDELAASIGNDLYEDIYARVLGDLEAIIASGEISVLVNAFQDQIDAVAVLTETSVLGVSTYLGNEGVSLGSGVVYRHDALANDYYIITNEHVVADGDHYRIVFADESYVTGVLIGSDATVDIAVLRFSGADLPYAITVSPLGDSDLLTTGNVVLAAGHPRGYDFYNSLTMGVVGGTGRDVGGDGVVLYIQHDASINSGNSGGPLYNLAGEVIGINVSKYASTEIEGMGFAIPINTVKTVLDTLDTGF